MPWITAYGNHDGLLQGNLAPSSLAQGYAVGTAKLLGLPPGFTLTQLLEALSGNPTLFNQLVTGPSRPATADPNRRILSRRETVAEYFKTSGTPVGHGFTHSNRARGTAYYTFLRSNVRCIVLDTVNPNGDANGSIDQAQLKWVARLLDANSKVRLSPRGARQHAGGTDRLIMLFSHHTIDTMDNSVTGPRAPGARVLGDDTLSLFGTIIDSAAPLGWKSTSNPDQLAALSRELSANDWQERVSKPDAQGHDGRRGAIHDRNVELLVHAPFSLASQG